MLVLSRYCNESILIGGDVRVVVVEIRGDKVRLGVEAPRSMPVHREEVARTIERHEPYLLESMTYQAIVEYGFHLFGDVKGLRQYFANPDLCRESRRQWFCDRKRGGAK